VADFLAGAIVTTRLGNVTEVTDLVGTDIFRGMLPQKPAYPCIVVQRVPNGSRRTKGAYSDPGYAIVPVQVISLAKTQDEADAVAEQVRIALERFGSAQPAGIPFAGTTLFDIEKGTEAEGYLEEIEGFFVTADYIVHHLETAP
jgi:hypothetical protein